MNILSNLEKALNVSLSKSITLKQAFIHRSYLNETKEAISSNERLEFLGDSILSFLVSEFLYRQYPELPEGKLTSLRSSIVKTATLAIISKKLNLGDCLYLSKGEEESGGRTNPSLLADTFEALIGTIYLEFGLIKVQSILKKYLFPLLNEIIKNKQYRDAKSAFQEIVQEILKLSPMYKVLFEEGPDHQKTFTVGVYVGNKCYGKGKGKNKHQAEENAASNALENWTQK